MATWKKTHEEHGAFRKQSGTKDSQALQSADNPNDVVILIEWNTIKKAKASTESPNLKETMKKAGVTGPPNSAFRQPAGTYEN